MSGQSYLSMLPADATQRAQSCTVWDFAGTPDAATKVGRLVRQGIKTTTSSLNMIGDIDAQFLPAIPAQRTQ